MILIEKKTAQTVFVSSTPKFIQLKSKIYVKKKKKTSFGQNILQFCWCCLFPTAGVMKTRKTNRKRQILDTPWKSTYKYIYKKIIYNIPRRKIFKNWLFFFKNKVSFLVAFLIEKTLGQGDETRGRGVQGKDDIVELDRDLGGVVEGAVLLLHWRDEENAHVEDPVAEETQAVRTIRRSRNFNLFRKKSAAYSVPDPWHFGVDPDPRIHASD